MLRWAILGALSIACSTTQDYDVLKLELARLNITGGSRLRRGQVSLEINRLKDDLRQGMMSSDTSLYNYIIERSPKTQIDAKQLINQFTAPLIQNFKSGVLEMVSRIGGTDAENSIGGMEMVSKAVDTIMGAQVDALALQIFNLLHRISSEATNIITHSKAAFKDQVVKVIANMSSQYRFFNAMHAEGFSAVVLTQVLEQDLDKRWSSLQRVLEEHFTRLYSSSTKAKQLRASAEKQQRKQGERIIDWVRRERVDQAGMEGGHAAEEATELVEGTIDPLQSIQKRFLQVSEGAHAALQRWITRLDRSNISCTEHDDLTTRGVEQEMLHSASLQQSHFNPSWPAPINRPGVPNEGWPGVLQQLVLSPWQETLQQLHARAAAGGLRFDEVVRLVRGSVGEETQQLQELFVAKANQSSSSSDIANWLPEFMKVSMDHFASQVMLDAVSSIAHVADHLDTPFPLFDAVNHTVFEGPQVVSDRVLDLVVGGLDVQSNLTQTAWQMDTVVEVSDAARIDIGRSLSVDIGQMQERVVVTGKTNNSLSVSPPLIYTHLVGQPVALLPTAPPPPPLEVVATAINSSAVRVQWLPPPSGPVEGYQVMVGQDSDLLSIVFDGPSTITQWEVGGLVPGTGFQFAVASTNSLGVGSRSGWVATETSLQTLSPPKVELVRRDNGMGSSVWSVQWKTPEVPANTGLVSGGFYYRLEAMANGDPSSIWDAWRGQTKDTEVEVPMGKRVQFRVSLVSTLTTGLSHPPSEWSSLTTPPPLLHIYGPPEGTDLKEDLGAEFAGADLFNLEEMSQL